MATMKHVNPDDIRTLFSRAMSDMYRAEVPQYGALLELVAIAAWSPEATTSLALPANSVDLIYLDPPFNSNASYNVLLKAPDGHQPVSACLMAGILVSARWLLK
jgi:16S rRNA G966 N2-methylase RsmD